MKNRELIGNYFNVKGKSKSMDYFRVDTIEWSKAQNCFVAKNLTFNKVSNEPFELICHIQDLRPIPLTEDILLKCRFKYQKGNYVFENLNMYAYLSLDYLSDDFILYPTKEQILAKEERAMNKFKNGEGLILASTYESGISDVRIKYLHQLQNLYFALTGKELEIKL